MIGAMRPTARALAAAAVFSFVFPAPAQAQKLPNLVEITPRLFTSGQPGADALGDLKAQGFEAVIYLAPPTVSDAVKDEPLILARQGITYVNIPIRFSDPTEADFETFAAVVSSLAPRKVLVHCQVNMRASSMVFLYRAIKLKEPPDAAYKAVAQVWSPHGPWKKLMEAQLRKNGIAFEPY
ncbi:hypothetical protein DSM104443_00587 [Usitatibacter rugosus]|uniref:DSP-PTPase phosphatase fused to NAD+ Kinase domain-containing protein n=2 Tax=Usitatibacter rugosus TaxID=2732067 RepID=A0A6M4GRU9_9PROT|nr:hypothetical protein DSM104443_00587 [Usitatibacter rugosus]